MSTELRLVLRLLRRSPGFAAAAILCLAVGLGASTAAFSVLDAVVLRPMPFPDADRLVDVHETSATQLCAGCAVGTSYDGFADWRRDARAFDAMAAYVERPMVLGGDGVTDAASGRPAGRVAERVQGAIATPALFALLGARPALGRALVDADDRVGAERVAVIGHALWRRRFGGDSGVIGRAIVVDGVPHTIVGVAAPRFRFPEFAELWAPLATASHDGGRANRELGVVARLRAGVSVAAASAEMAALARGIARAHPDTQAEWSAAATSLRADMAGDEAAFGWTLIGAVLLVQLVVCANLAGLMLARAAARWRELAVRSALGAGRLRLARHVVAEIAVLAAAGALVGFQAASAAVRAAARWADGQIPYWIELRVDWRVAAFCVLLTAVSVLVVGAVVARRASRPDVQSALKDAGPTASASRRHGRLRAALVVAELSVSLVLLAGAGLMVKTFVRVARPADGEAAARTVLADVPFLGARWTDSSRLAPVAAELTARLARMPSVEAAALSRSEFLAGFGRDDAPIAVEGRATVPAGASPRFAFAVTPGWRAARGMRLVAGRDVSASDGAGAPGVVVINEAMARRLWPDDVALGRRVKLGAAASRRPWLTVVGVVADEPTTRDSAASLAYVPFAQWPGRPTTLVLRARSADDATATVRALPAVAAAALGDEPVEHPRTIAADVRERFRPWRLIATAIAALAAFAVLVAAVGVYGVVAYGATRRAREIGIRVTLGATPRDVRRLFGGEAARLAAAGALFGLGGAAAATRVIRSMLFGASPIDPLVFAAVTALLALVALAAGYVPARRAARVDPATVLRNE